MNPAASDAAVGPVAQSRLAELLRGRSFRAVELKQGWRHLCRGLPPAFQKKLEKLLWPPPLRHMRYVPPAVVIQPVADDVWTIRHRAGEAPVMRSRPLRELRGSVTTPAIVITTGPTANEFDWPTLREGRHVIWAVNGAPILLEKQGLKCEFLVITDHRFARESAEMIVLAAEQGATLCFSYEAAAGFAAVRPEVLERTPFFVMEKANAWFGLPAMASSELSDLNERAEFPFVLPAPIKPGVGWSHNPALGLFAGRTVAFAALQLVVWSGSREIGVVGLDLGGNSRAYKEVNPAISHLEKDLEEYILPAFECMAAALAGRSIRILNHSTTSPLARELVPDVP